MTRSARRHSPATAGIFKAALASTAQTVSRNPVIVGSTTAFLVTLFYVSANAIWYQPGAHPHAFFATRTLPASLLSGVDAEPALPETTIRIEEEAPAAVPQLADPMVVRLQEALAARGHYRGAVDGVAGPQTVEAIQKFQAEAGLERDGEISDGLLKALSPDRRSSTVEVPPLPTGRGETSQNPTTASIGAADQNVRKVQAGLRAFGNDGIEIDGLMGPATRSAIREFQTLFGLPVTGEIDAGLMAKMQETGLTN